MSTITPMRNDQKGFIKGKRSLRVFHDWDNNISDYKISIYGIGRGVSLPESVFKSFSFDFG